jgi:hypothetical protein
MRYMTSIEDLKDEIDVKNAGERTRYDEVLRDCFTPECDEAVQELTRGRLNLAYPIVEEGKKHPPDANRLKEIIAQTCRKGPAAERALALIDKLAVLRDKLGKGDQMLEVFF